jgi:Periplasmic copper-binding protein CueP
MKKIIVTSLIFIILLNLAACGNKSNQKVQVTSTNPIEGAISPTVLDELNIREALELANKWKTSNPEITSFITPNTLNFEFDDKKKIEISLPHDSMIIAIAPYIEKTHKCSTHYISGCQGELVDIPIKVMALQEDGTVLINQTLTTMSNGFIELWLPRDKNITLTMESMNRKAEGTLTTFSDSKTCITTMNLL